jgi:hypothetical protein
MRRFFQRRPRAIVIVNLSILVITGLLLVSRSAQTLYDRQFSVPQKVDLEAVASNPAAFEDRYIQVAGILTWRGFALCEGRTLTPPGYYALTAGGKGIVVDAALRDYSVQSDPGHFGIPVVMSGWMRRWDGWVGCDYRPVRGPNETHRTTEWYFEPIVIGCAPSPPRPRAQGNIAAGVPCI